MKIEIHHYHHYDDDIRDDLTIIKSMLQNIQRKEVKVTMTLDELQAQVKANTDVESSAITLINGLAAQITANANDPVKVQAMADQLKASATALSQAITANTPAAPAK